MSNAELLKLSDQELFDEIPAQKRKDFTAFIKELNRREFLVRFDKSCTFNTFEHLPGTAKLFKDGFLSDSWKTKIENRMKLKNIGINENVKNILRNT